MRVPSAGGAFVKRSQIPPVSMPRSVFDLSRGHKTSLDAGVLVPLLVEEVLPGDTFRVRATVLARLATLLYPLMDNIYMDLHWFFVPMRLVWTNTEKFFGAQDNPADSVSYTIPQTVAAVPGYANKLADYMGINPYCSGNVVFNTLQFRGYRRIWNEWYRDENLQNSVPVSYGDGPDNQAQITELLPRNKRGDYFTLALPWPQKGTAVQFPLGSAAVIPSATNAAPTFKFTTVASGGSLVAATTADQPAVNVTSPTGTWTAGQQLQWDASGLVADMSTLTGNTINAFRQANAMQVYLERNARGGTRYPEYLKAQWGVTSSDARLQRTEFLGGSSAPLMVSPVAQTSAKTPDTNSLGDLGATGTFAHHGSGFVKSFEEHGFVYGLVSIRADLNYQRGMPKQFFRRTVFDIANPAFANIGEQPVYNKEIWYDGVGAYETQVFGYQERYAEYKQSYSMLTGNMRSESPTSYDVWHVAQNLATQPTLGDTFIRENPDIDRVIATPFIDQFNLDSLIEIKAARCLPVWGVPGLGARL